MTIISDYHEKTRWTLDEALILIRQLQSKAHECNYHIALAGSVLNKGESIKDLDLLVVPLHNSNPVNKEELIEHIQKTYGAEFRDGSIGYDGDEARYDQLLVFEKNVSDSIYKENFKRLDVFIYGDE